MNMRIDEIEIGKRVRKDLGDLKPLMESLRLYGLLNPVVVNRNKELIAGHRRLESARLLGWKHIEVKVLEAESDVQMLELEIEENLHRRSLAVDELADAYNLLDRLKNPSLMRKILNAIRRFFASIFRRKKH